MTWWERFAALWAVVELSCRRCHQAHKLVCRLCSFLALISAVGWLLPVFADGALTEAPRWLRYIAIAFAWGVAVPFLLFGVVSAALALVGKYVLSKLASVKRCPQCGGRQWQVTDYGVEAFRSSF